MPRGSILSLIGMVALTATVGAQPPGAGGVVGSDALRFTRATSRDGLSHNTVLCLLQDRRGFLWIGTADGLNRFDGYAFAVFRHDPADPASLSDNTVQALAEGPDGVLWVGTAAGLDRLDPVTGKVERAWASGLDVSALAFDPEGRLWVSSAGLHRYDVRTGRLEAVRDVVPVEPPLDAQVAARLEPDAAHPRPDQQLAHERVDAHEFRIFPAAGRGREAASGGARRLRARSGS